MIAESYGGADEPVDTLVSSFVSSGIEQAIPPLRVKEVPNEQIYQTYEESGTDFAQKLQTKKNLDDSKKSMPIDISKVNIK